MVFRRSSIRYGRTPEPQTPYQKAAQVWDERIGSARVQARNWRTMAFGSLILSAGLASALVWQSLRGSVVPWVVEVDKLGQAQVVAPATADYTPADPQIAWYLAEFIKDVRSAPADSVIVRQNWLRAYDFTTTSGAVALNEYARADDPFAKLGKQEGRPSTFQASFAPRPLPSASPGPKHRYEDGALTDNARWTAILTISIDPPTDAEKLRKNPLGIYVSAIKLVEGTRTMKPASIKAGRPAFQTPFNPQNQQEEAALLRKTGKPTFLVEAHTQCHTDGIALFRKCGLAGLCLSVMATWRLRTKIHPTGYQL